MELLRQYFMPVDVLEIVKIKANIVVDDTLAWGPDKFGRFSVKSAYDLGFQEAHLDEVTGSSTIPEGRRACWSLIWKSKPPPTVKNFAWRACIDSLTTWPNMLKRTLVTTDLCPICQRELESTFHALCRCPLSVGLWEAMAEVWPLPQLSKIVHTGVEWMLNLLAGLDSTQITMVMLIFWWCGL